MSNIFPVVGHPVPGNRICLKMQVFIHLLYKYNNSSKLKRIGAGNVPLLT